VLEPGVRQRQEPLRAVRQPGEIDGHPTALCLHDYATQKDEQAAVPFEAPLGIEGDTSVALAVRMLEHLRRRGRMCVEHPASGHA